MKQKYIIESDNSIISGTEVEIKGNSVEEFQRRKAWVEANPVVKRLIPKS